MESKLSHSQKSTQDQFLLVIILIVFSVILGFVCSPNEMVGIAWEFVAPEASEVSLFILCEDTLEFPNKLFPSALIHCLLRASQIHSQLTLHGILEMILFGPLV